MMVKTDDFFKMLYQRCNVGSINFRFLKKDGSAGNEFLLVDSLLRGSGSALPMLEEHQGENCHFGVALRNGNNGTKGAITQIPALWVDLDGAPLEKVLKSPWLPSAVVETSPGKFHVYWRLKEPAGNSDIKKVEELLRRLQAHFKGDPCATDASRVLRIPGSLNHKISPPFRVIVKEVNEAEYNLSDFDILPEAGGVSFGSQKHAPGWERDLLMNGVPEGQRNSSMASLAGSCIAKGFSKEEILPILLTASSQCTPPLDKAEVERVLNSVIKVHCRNHPPEESGLEFPLGIMGGLAGEFAELYAAYLESPVQFFFVSFLTCLGLTVADRLTLDSEIAPQPRFFVVLLGESADDRKSTAISKTTAFFETALSNKDFPVSWGVGSAEGLQRLLGRQGNAGQAEGKKLLLCLDEFKQFVSKCKIEGSILLPCVNSLFESNKYEGNTKTLQIRLDEAYLAMLAASTVKTYENTWSNQFTDIGFNNRLFLVPGGGKRKYAVPMSIPETEKEKIRRRLKEISREIGGHTVLPMTKRARDLHEAWYLTLPSSVHTKRIDTYALRLMPLLTVNEGRTEVDEGIVEKTLTLCNWQVDVRRLHDPVDADNELARMEEKIRRVLGSKGSLKEWDIKRQVNANRSGLWVFNTAIGNLKSGGEIAFDPGSRAYSMAKKGLRG